MIILAKTIGLVICGFGILFLVLPEKTKTIMEFFKRGSRIYWSGITRILIAVVLFLSAAQSNDPAIAVVLGLLFVTSGILIFVVGPEKGKELIQSWENQSTLVYRLLGLIVLCFGLLILYAA